MKSLKDILNEDSAAEIQADENPGQSDSKNLIPLKAGKFTRKSLIRTMRKPEGYIQTSDGQQYSIAHPIDQSSMWGDKTIFVIDQDGGEKEINYDDITSYSETYDEDDAMLVRSMTYDGMEMPKTKIGILTAMKRELRGMKVADIKASYQYIKAAHCNTKEGMQGIGTKKDMLTAMMKDLRGMKKDALMASYGYIKSSQCGPHEAAHEPEEINASSCTSESVDLDLSEAIDFSKVTDKNLISWVTKFRTVKGMPWNDFKQDMAAAEKEVTKRKLKIEGVDLEEMKTKDDDLAVMIYDYIGADTEGLPLKTLIHQAVGKYFGSQKDKKKVNEATIVKSQKPFDANSELMRVVNTLDQAVLNSLWDFKIIDKKRPVDVEGAIFPLYRDATLKIFNVRGQFPFTDEQKKYIMDVYADAQKGAGFGRGRKWHKMEFSKDGMSATAKITVRTKEILDKNKF